MEVYIPWNNTWLDLPPLPDLVDGDSWPMDETRIMFIEREAGSFLYLLGGSNHHWNTESEKTIGRVWRLQWDKGFQNYSWTTFGNQALGRYLGPNYTRFSIYFPDTVFASSGLAVGIPENFLDW